MSEQPPTNLYRLTPNQAALLSLLADNNLKTLHKDKEGAPKNVDPLFEEAIKHAEGVLTSLGQVCDGELNVAYTAGFVEGLRAVCRHFEVTPVYPNMVESVVLAIRESMVDVVADALHRAVLQAGRR